MDHRVDASPATFRFDVRQLTADDVTLTPRPKDPPAPPDRFRKLLKVGELGVRIGHLVARLLEFAEKLGLCNWRRLPVAKSS
jgi:hypothetical protein